LDRYLGPVLYSVALHAQDLPLLKILAAVLAYRVLAGEPDGEWMDRQFPVNKLNDNPPVRDMVFKPGRQL
jgi:hypothetical protein